MAFDVVDLEQGSPEWLQWRARGIGASEAPAIMRENPWKSLAQLRQEKLQPRFHRPANAAMARGTALEPVARALYCERKKIDVRPQCIESREYRWMRASLDGACFERGALVEIKCGEATYRRASRHQAVPDYYYGQLQHILAVTGYQVMDFWCYLPGRRPILIEVERNPAYIERLIESERRFWDTIEADVIAALAARPSPRTP